MSKKRQRKNRFLDEESEDKQSNENPKKGSKCKQENVLHSYYDEEDSRNENAASWEIAGA